MTRGRNRLRPSERKVVFTALVLSALFLLASAGGCGSGEDEEHLGKQSQALDAATSDGGCREVTLQASRSRHDHGHEHRREHGHGRGHDDCQGDDERELSPPMRVAIPSEIALSGTTNNGAHRVTLTFDLASGGEVECKYKGGAGHLNDRALLVSCSHGRHAGDIVRAEELSLELEDNTVATARITLSEAAPCGPDASTDASIPADTGTGVDTGVDTGAGVDASPECTPETCVPSGACLTATCTSSGCQQAPLPAGAACSDGSACTTFDACDGAGHCSGISITLPPSTTCLESACDPVLGIVQIPALDGTTCVVDACTVGSTCSAGSCAGGAPRDCSSGQVCVTDSCDVAAGGCVHTPKPSGTPVPDSDLCNGTETCSPTGTVVAGLPLVCNSNNLCVVDGCAPTTGCTQTTTPHCDPTPVAGQGDAPFETRASIMGQLLANGSAVTGASFTITNAPAEGAPANPPRGDVSASTASDGSFRVRLTTFPEVEVDRTPPLHVLVRIDTSSYLPAYRDAWLHPGNAVDLGIIKLVARDPAVTSIGPAGGTASDSQNRISVVIPPGALTTTVPIRITPIVNRDEMPAELPASTSTEFGMELEPTGTTFAVPVTVRLANWRNAPTNLAIPTGFYDLEHGRWEHLATATWDGTRFSFQTTHFTDIDGNAAKVAAPAPAPSPGPPPDPKCPENTCCGQPIGSSCGRLGGGVAQRFALPTYRVKNEDFGLHLTYDSGLAGSRRLGVGPSDYAAVSHSSFGVSVQDTRFEVNAVPRADIFSPVPSRPGRCVSSTTSFGDTPSVPLTLTRSLAGATTIETFSMGPANGEADFGGYVNLPLLSPTSTSGSGLYRTHLSLRAQTSGSCIASGGTFGVSDFASPGTQTALEDGPLASFDTMTLVHHRLTSPYGAGWAVGDVSRVYRDGDVAYLVSGDGGTEHFAPRAHAKSLPTAGTQILARDPRTGEIFTAHDSGSIERVDAVTGTTTTAVSGLSFNVPVHGLAVAYVGAAREFIVALQDRLLEIDAGGAQRVLTTRAAGGLASQASVAAHDDVVFYAASLAAPILYRVRLTDPARTLESMSLASGGDVRFFPRASLSGVSFADPRGLAFASDGTLYVADRGRNAVYAVSPDGTGVVTGASRVEPVMGDGQGGYLPPLGERQPGVRYSLREPLSVSVTEDGLLFVATTYGISSFDPIAREAENLVLWGGIDELTLRPIQTRVSVLGLSATTALSRAEISGGASLVRFDVDRMSSQHEPTRTIRRLAGAELELTDTRNDLVERFDAAGRLVQRSKRTGETVMTATYVDARGDAVDRITDAAGGETVFSYAGGKLQSITDARGRVTQVTVNGLGDLVSVTEPGSETHTFGYAEHRMTEKRSPRGDLTTYSYRADGTLDTATRPEGAITTMDAALSHPPVFNAAGKIERRGSYVDARGVSHDTLVNLRGEVEQDTHVEDGVTRVDTVTYATTLQDIASVSGASLFLDSVSDRKNRLFRVASRAQNGVQLGTTTEFDAHGRPIRERRPGFGTGAQDVHRWQYDDLGWLLEEYQGPANMADHYERDALGHVTRIFDRSPGLASGTVSGRERRWTYRADGMPATTTEHGVTRTYAYAELPGSLNEMGWTDTLGRTMTLGRDAAGNVTSTSDGTTTTYAAYDARNRVTETRDALANATTYGYTNAGCGCSQENLVTSIHTPDLTAGVEWLMAYDHEGRLATVSDPHGFVESYAYETTGELKKLTDKLARDTTWSHDQLGRVLAMVDTLGRTHASTYTVPVAGAWTGPSLMAGSGDAAAPAISLTGSLRNGDYQIGKNAYQPAGAAPRISLYRDATFALGFTHTFDVANRLTRRDDRATFAIDSAATPPGVNGAFWNDVRDYNVNTSRPLLESLSAARTASATEAAFLTHDRDFDVHTTDGFGSSGLGDTTLQETYTRDAGGRPTLLLRRFPGLDFTGGDVTSTYAYRPDGRLSQLVNRDGTHDFTYDSRGLMQTQTVTGEGTYTYGYDVMGRPSSLTYPDGHVRTQLYDDLGRITSRCYEYSGPTERCYTAQYDAVGNPTRMADPDGVDVLEYDALDRLKRVTREVGGVAVAVEDYDYNALGALKVNAGVALAHQRPRLDGAGSADAAVPASAGGLPVTLDAGGRVTSLRGATFTWSREGFLRQAQEPIPAVGETYEVATDFRRIAKLQGSTKEVYIYEGLDRVATVTASGAVMEAYLFDGIDHPLRIKISSPAAVTAYYELDLAGNVRGVRASGGADLGGYRYSAFGQTLEDTSSITQPLRWKGRWFSPVAGGTYDVRARQWSPELGVFLSVDEFRYHDEKSTLWGWPNQSPTRWRDPFGHRKDVCDSNDTNCGGYSSPYPGDGPPTPPSPAPAPGGFGPIVPPGGPGQPGNDNSCKPSKKFCDELQEEATTGCVEEIFVQNPDTRPGADNFGRLRKCVREVMHKFGCPY